MLNTEHATRNTQHSYWSLVTGHWKRMKICMVTSSYPKHPGDVTAPFIESIATYVAARGHEVHVLAPWHPDLRRGAVEQGVHLHFFKYAPMRGLNIWGYAASLEADVRVKWAIYPLTPVVMARGLAALRRLARRVSFDLLQVHWPIPNGPMAALAAWRGGLPLVASLHGSDVFIAERHPLAGLVARRVFAACEGISASSEDLRQRAIRLGASAEWSRLIPYGSIPAPSPRSAGPGWPCASGWGWRRTRQWCSRSDGWSIKRVSSI